MICLERYLHGVVKGYPMEGIVERYLDNVTSMSSIKVKRTFFQYFCRALFKPRDTKSTTTPDKSDDYSWNIT